MKLVKRERVAEGWKVTVEVPKAYRDGRSRMETIYIPVADLVGLDGQGVLAVVKRALEEDPFATVLGADLSRVQAAPPREDIAARLREIAENTKKEERLR